MARIDKFLEAAFKHQFEELKMTPGEKVTVVIDGSSRALSAQEISQPQIRAFISEVANGEKANIESGEAASFGYESPTGTVEIAVDSGGAVSIRPSGNGASSNGSSAQDAGAPISVSGGAKIDELFRKMVDEGCSDLHLSADNPPLYRKDGDIMPLGDTKVRTPEEVRAMLMEITSAPLRDDFEKNHDIDFSYQIDGLARFRCNMFMDRLGAGGVFRIIPTDIPSAEDLGLPKALTDLTRLHKGLVVVTGPTGSGKSTTLAAMIDYINAKDPRHIITIEDPIEFVHPKKKCLINQREVHTHTHGFRNALRAALREDPDIVLLGEMRDLETVEIALETAETGHLVFGTLHTNTAASTVDRIIDQFSPDQQAQIRVLLSETLKGVVAQTLCKRKGGGRVAAQEVLIVNSAISNLIREGKTFQIPSLMQTGKGIGMQTMDSALLELIKGNKIEVAEALSRTQTRTEFEGLLARNEIELPKAA